MQIIVIIVSMKFGNIVDKCAWNIFGYGAIKNLGYHCNGGNFKK